MKDQEQRISVTVDNGHSYHKVAWINEAGEICLDKVPAILGKGTGFIDTTGKKVDAYVVKGDEGERLFTCNESVDKPISIRHSTYPVSIENRVLFTHVLNKVGLLNRPIETNVTLPYDDFYLGDGSLNIRLIDEVKKNFSQNNVRSASGDSKGCHPIVRKVTVMSEALCGWFDWSFDEQCQPNQNFAGVMEEGGITLVIDIGGSTTDIVAVKADQSHGVLVLPEKSGSIKKGVLDVMGIMEKSFFDQLAGAGSEYFGGHDNQLSMRQKQGMLARGTVRYGGEDHNIESIRSKACEHVAAEIISYVKERAGNLRAFYSVIVIGGGSIVFKDALSRSLGVKAEFLDEYSNARGSLKLKVHQDRADA